MNELKVFKNELFQVSVKLENGQTVFDVETIARSLGLVGVSTKSGGKKYEWVRWDRVNEYLKPFATSGEDFPQVAKGDFIPESAVYKLAFKASNEVAEKFQDWLAVDVLPQIRQTGGYIPNTEDDTEEDILAKAILIAQKTIERKNNLIAEKDRLIEEQHPKVLFADSVSASHTSILVGDLAKIIKQNGHNIGGNRLFAWMRDNGYLIKRKGTDYNMPTQRSMELEAFEIKETIIAHSDGHMGISKTPKVTGKGQIYFINKFCMKEAI